MSMLQALFYPKHFALIEVADLVRGRNTDGPHNFVEFPEEEGGTAEQNLAVPLLPGMDEIEVEEARLVLRAAPRDLDVQNYSVTANGQKGIFLSLPSPARLKKIELHYPIPLTDPGKTLRLVVREATPDGSGFAVGVPLFAFPALDKAGPMYKPTLGGMTVTGLTGDRHLVRLPSILGTQWLIQLATGNDVTQLSPLDVTPVVNRVTLDAVPRNLSVILAGSSEVTLWNHPGSLLPENGEQEVSFTPLGRRHLSAALKSASPTDVTLSVPLRFESESGGAIDITATSLKSEYIVRPLDSEQFALRLGGDLTPLVLSAPASLIPKGSSMRLTARLLGRELNAASPEPPVFFPASGWRVDLNRSVATAASVAALPGQVAGSLLEVASARVLIATEQEAELVLELRSDIAQSPGAIAAPPVVRQIESGFKGWLEFEFPKPVLVVAGQAPLWLSLRATRGEVLWYASAEGYDLNRISTDRGESWGAPEQQLTSGGRLWAQFFHVVNDALTVPAIRLQLAGNILTADLLAGAAKKSAREFFLEAGALPAAIHSRLASRQGQGRIDTEFVLFSRSVLDLTLENLAIRYDPFQQNT